MIQKFSYNPKINTGAVVQKIDASNAPISFFTLSDGVFSYRMSDAACVYGLGEAMRGMNKRGWIYESWCTDQPNHNEDTRSLYGAHNFLLIDGDDRFGVFFDYPTRITFDIGYTDPSLLTVKPADLSLDVYIVTGDSLKGIVREFRALIGKSYIPPLWGFGYGQSRWGYVTEKDIAAVADQHEAAGIPLDMIYLDIDYMDSFKDFTVNRERYPDFKGFIEKMRARGYHMIPIIDAAVKKEEGYPVYDEGHEKGYFCTNENGDDFVVGVWPGMSCLPDFLNPAASEWFGAQYRALTDAGVDGFWNDMNEPALFYSEGSLNAAFDKIKTHEGKTLSALSFFDTRDVFNHLANSKEDYDSFYHNAPEGRFCHADVHNLYGYKMTESAANALKELRPDEPTLLFSRASYIGAHRCGGIWTGDNHSRWCHLLQSIRQMPGLNMCGFLYSGSDIGGFGGDCTRDLLIRWLSFAIFTPLMRNHSAIFTRDQEATAFGDTEVFRHIITLRYCLIPYLYGAFVKAAENNEMFFRPLCFDYEDDPAAREIEDQLMVGDRLMIAPVYLQNTTGRNVYLPEDMTLVRMSGGEITTEPVMKGRRYFEVPLGDVVFFTKGALPLAEPAKNTAELDMEHLTYIAD